MRVEEPRLTFELFACRFHFRARESVRFPSGQSGNLLRGAFGTIFRKLSCVPECRDARTCERRSECSYARIFEPEASGGGPSGLRHWPRPFVFRAYHLDGLTAEAGQNFHFDVHLFDVRNPAIEPFALTFAQLGQTGVGPERGRAELTRVDMLGPDGRPGPSLWEAGTFLASGLPEPMVLNLSPAGVPVTRVLVRFLSPTELKSEQSIAPRPEFPILFARIRDRLSTLRQLYGKGALEIDFRAAGKRAADVSMPRCDLEWISESRTSSRTGQRHPLGGFVGEAEYEGDMSEFLPYLLAARWVGVGRQTVWGKGVVEVETA